jgi:hypothetical protein
MQLQLSTDKSHLGARQLNAAPRTQQLHQTVEYFVVHFAGGGRRRFCLQRWSAPAARGPTTRGCGGGGMGMPGFGGHIIGDELGNSFLSHCIFNVSRGIGSPRVNLSARALGKRVAIPRFAD